MKNEEIKGKLTDQQKNMLKNITQLHNKICSNSSVQSNQQWLINAKKAAEEIKKLFKKTDFLLFYAGLSNIINHYENLIKALPSIKEKNQQNPINSDTHHPSRVIAIETKPDKINTIDLSGGRTIFIFPTKYQNADGKSLYLIAPSVPDSKECLQLIYQHLSVPEKKERFWTYRSHTHGHFLVGGKESIEGIKTYKTPNPITIIIITETMTIAAINQFLKKKTGEQFELDTNKFGTQNMSKAKQDIIRDIINDINGPIITINDTSTIEHKDKEQCIVFPLKDHSFGNLGDFDLVFIKKGEILPSILKRMKAQLNVEKNLSISLGKEFSLLKKGNLKELKTKQRAGEIDFFQMNKEKNIKEIIGWLKNKDFSIQSLPTKHTIIKNDQKLNDFQDELKKEIKKLKKPKHVNASRQKNYQMNNHKKN